MATRVARCSVTTRLRNPPPPGRDTCPGAWSTFDAQSRPDPSCALVHDTQAEATGRRRLQIEPATIVFHPNAQLHRVEPHFDLDAGGAGVLAAVVQRFLHDAVQPDLHFG